MYGVSAYIWVFKANVGNYLIPFTTMYVYIYCFFKSTIHYACLFEVETLHNRVDYLGPTREQKTELATGRTGCAGRLLKEIWQESEGARERQAVSLSICYLCLALPSQFNSCQVAPSHTENKSSLPTHSFSGAKILLESRPRKINEWQLKITQLERKIIFQPPPQDVNFLGCRLLDY